MRKLAFVIVLLSCSVSCVRKQESALQEETTPPDTAQVTEVPAQVETVHVVTVETLVESVYVGGGDVVSSAIRPSTGTFAVQIGAFHEEQNATALHNMLKAEYGDLIYLEDIAPYWKVRVGGYESRSQAMSMMEQLRSRGYRDAWIVSVG